VVALPRPAALPALDFLWGVPHHGVVVDLGQVVVAEPLCLYQGFRHRPGLGVLPPIQFPPNVVLIKQWLRRALPAASPL
jgi:hypothetical protein